MPITHEKEWNKQFVNILYKLLKKFQNEYFIKSSNTIENFKSLDEITKAEINLGRELTKPEIANITNKLKYLIE